MKRKFLECMAILTLIGNSIVAQEPWTRLPDFPGGARFGSIGIVIGNKAYVGLGLNNNSNFFKDLWEYDPINRTWTQKADLPGEGRVSATAFTIGNKAYIGTGKFGDNNFLNDFYEFDPVLNTWTRKTDFPGGGCYQAVSFTIGSKGYVGTGYNGGYKDDFWEYDPSTDIWSSKADVPEQGRTSAIGFSIGNKGYIGLGLYIHSTFKKDLWEYDPALNNWTRKADLPAFERRGAVAFSIGNKGYVGNGIYYFLLNDMWEYDPAINRWMQKMDASLIPRSQGIGFNIENKIYLGLGNYHSGLVSDLWEYSPSTTTHLPALYFDAIAVSTLAGDGTMAFEDGPGTVAKFNYPNDVATDHAGNVYVADVSNHRIRKITPAGIVSTFAGTGIRGFQDGISTIAQFSYPGSVALDAYGNVIVADNNRIRKITPAGVVSTLAGSGVAGFEDGITTEAKFNNPSGVEVDISGNVYVADNNNHSIRKITATGMVTTIAGNGSPGTDDGVGTNATLYNPTKLSLDPSGNLYVTEFGPFRKISPSGLVTTVTAEGLFPSYHYGVVVDPAGIIYISITYTGDRNFIYKITPGGVASLVAGGVTGFQDGIGANAKFYYPLGMALDDSGNLYVAENTNNRIRKISTPKPNLSTVAGTASAAQFLSVTGIYLSGNITLTAPSGFEISQTAGSGYASVLSLPPVSGEIVSVPIYIRIKSSVGAGNYTGNITLTSAGAIAQTLSVTGTVTDTVPPVIQCPADQTLCFKNSNNYTVPNLTATDISGIQTITYSITGATNRNGTGANASGFFKPGISTIKWIVTDGAGNSSSCQTSIRVDMPLYVSIPNVYPLLFWGQVNTLYIGFGPACVTLTALPSGGTRLQGRYNYAWSTGSTTKSITVCRAVAGSYVYTVTVTDSLGCQATASKTINVIDVRCGQNLKKVWVCWFGNYQYCVTEGQAALALLFGAKLGTCNSPVVTSANGSRNNSEEAGVIEDKKITVFPNPNNGSFTVLLNNLKTSEIRILDQNGKIISRRMVNGMNKSQTINMNPGVLAKGMYVVQAISKDGVYTCKMMVQ